MLTDTSLSSLLPASSEPPQGALAKYMNSYSFTMKNWKNIWMMVFLILFPMMLIILQRETGSALVYTAFFLVLYREGMPGVVLFSGLCAVVYFVVGIRFYLNMLGKSYFFYFWIGGLLL